MQEFPFDTNGRIALQRNTTTKIMKPANRMPNGTNVRFDARTKQRVERLAKKHGLKKADLVRNALLYKLDEWERHGVTFHAIQESAA